MVSGAHHASASLIRGPDKESGTHPVGTATGSDGRSGGVPDAGAHPYVGQLLFYDPTAIDARFDDPGGWFNCPGTLVSPTVVVTACSGTSGAYRLDQADDLAFLATFGITP